MQCVIAFAAACDFNTASSQLKQFLQSIFRTWLQSRINENANKVLREAERKKNATKVAWFVAFSHLLSAHEQRLCNSQEPCRIELCPHPGEQKRINVNRPAPIGILNTVIWPPKVSSHFSNWKDLADSDLMREYGRKEVEPDMHGNPDLKSGKLDRLFEEGTRLYIVRPQVSAGLAPHQYSIAVSPTLSPPTARWRTRPPRPLKHQLMARYP